MSELIEKRRSLNKQVNIQKQQNQLLKSHISQLQALANIGTVSAMTAHEINNILMPLGNYAQLAVNNIDDKTLVRKALQKVIDNSQRASEILESMLALANGDSDNMKTCRLKLLVEEVFACIGREFGKNRIKTNIQIPQDLAVWAVPVQIQQVLMNLIINACDAMIPAGGILTITAETNEQSVHISVSDSGNGIERDNLGKIFEPFFTTKSSDSAVKSGAGLGLAFCKQIIEAHDGSISVESKPGSGTTFMIVLPDKAS